MNNTEAKQLIDAIVGGIAPEVKKFVVEKFAELGTKIADLERGQMKYLGVWQPGRAYTKGNVVTHDGSMFHCEYESTISKPGDGEFWRLCVKRGKDGRDAGR